MSLEYKMLFILSLLESSAVPVIECQLDASSGSVHLNGWLEWHICTGHTMYCFLATWYLSSESRTEATKKKLYIAHYSYWNSLSPLHPYPVFIWLKDFFSFITQWAMVLHTTHTHTQGHISESETKPLHVAVCKLSLTKGKEGILEERERDREWDLCEES